MFEREMCIEKRLVIPRNTRLKASLGYGQAGRTRTRARTEYGVGGDGTLRSD